MTLPAVGLKDSVHPLTSTYDAGFLDLDGVVYLGEGPIDGAVDGVTAARAAGMRLAFVTNNASRTPAAVADQLLRMGVEAAADDVVTAAQAAARLLAAKVPAGSPVLVVGGAGLRAALDERGLRPVESASEDPVAVVQGFASDLTYRQLAEGAVAVRGGALFVASNLDRTLPSSRGPLPGNGALVEVLRTATGVEPIAAGKPEPHLYDEAAQRTGARCPLVVGDRLDTDIAGATRASMDSMAVLSGVTDLATLLRAGPDQRPSYVARDLSALARAQPPVAATSDGWMCSGWSAAVSGGVLRLAGTGDHDHAVRALCAAAWAQPEPPELTAAVQALAGSQKEAGPRLR